MSSRRTTGSPGSRRVPYKPRRDRREVYVAIGVAALIVIVTATLVWFLRPNKDSGSDDTPVITAPITQPTDTSTDTTAPTDSTTPTDTSTPTDSTQAPEETTSSAP